MTIFEAITRRGEVTTGGIAICWDSILTHMIAITYLMGKTYVASSQADRVEFKLCLGCCRLNFTDIRPAFFNGPMKY
jgi:hypothetical protein